MHTVKADGRINDLYWNSTRTIDEIVEETGIGRSTLYGSIVPLAVDAACRTCGGPMVFPNRMSRASGMASCDACGLSAPLRNPSDDLDETTAEDRVRSGSRVASGVRERRFLPVIPWNRFALIGGAAALGVMIGAAATRATR